VDVFEGPPREIESALAGVFDVVQRAGRLSGGSAPRMLEHIKSEVARLDRLDRARPVLAAVRDGLLFVLRLPANLMLSFTAAAGEQAGRDFASGRPPF
jgi:hypothetical protein